MKLYEIVIEQIILFISVLELLVEYFFNWYIRSLGTKARSL